MDYFTFDGKELLRFDYLEQANAYASHKSENVVIIAGKQESGPYIVSVPKLIEVDIEKVNGQTVTVDVKVNGMPLEEEKP